MSYPHARRRPAGPRVLFAPALLAALLLAATPARAERAPRTPEQLWEAASHVVTGRVIAVYERKETREKWKYTWYVAEVRVTGVDKGAGIEPGSLVYLRYWRRSWRGLVPPTSTYGHRELPSAGDERRFYAARATKGDAAGGLDVVGPNGFQPLDARVARSAPAVAIYTAEEIDAMTVDEARRALSRTAQARRHAHDDEALQAKLKEQFERLMHRVRRGE
jgi:hypothetical protein